MVRELAASKPRYVALALLAGGYFAAATASILLSRLGGDGIAGLWFANVLAFAMLARSDHPVTLADYAAVFAPSFAVNAVFGSSASLSLIFSVVNIGHLALALWLVRRFVGRLPLKVTGARAFGLVLVLAGGVATTIAGFAFGFAAFIVFRWSIAESAWAWLSGNALGYAMFLPLMLFATVPGLDTIRDWRALLRVAATAVVCAALACLFLVWGQFPFALAMLPLMIVAPRFAVVELAIICAFAGAACVTAAMCGFVPGLGQGVSALRDGFQVAVAVTVATPFLVGLFICQMVEDRRRVADAETRWNFALASAGQGVWDADIRKGNVNYSATWKGMLGYGADELDDDPDLWLNLVHPDDAARVAEADRDHLDGRTPVFKIEYRMRHKAGHWIWILDHGKAVDRDESGRAISAIGSMTDITERKETEERLIVSAALLADEKERLRVTLHSIGDAVICTDAVSRITFMNPVAEKLTGVASGEALGKTLGRVYWAVDEETGQRLDVARPSAGDLSDQNSRAVLIRGDSTRCSIRQVVSPIMNERNEFGGLVIVFQDFTDARALQRQLAYAAAHDALTGLANRSSFIRTMEDLVDQTRRAGTEHQFMFVDLDHFKLVNDTGGHAAGDALLKRVADAIRGTLGPADIVARLGGDEFAVILKSGSATAADSAAQSIIDAIRSLGFTWDGRSHLIGASIGLTPIRAGCGEVDEIIARADTACYAAKAAGRGCVSVAPAEAGAVREDKPREPFAAAS